MTTPQEPTAAEPIATIAASAPVEPAAHVEVPMAAELAVADVGVRPDESAPAIAPAGVAGLEERLGARLFVWIGGIALALAGAFLVKYSIDQGWLGPAVRCVLGVALGLLLLSVGEGMRAREGRIAQSLSAAGVAVLYASLFASIALYQLIEPSLGFLLLAGLTAAAIALALRQGPFVGLLGFAGGFLTPAIVHTDQPHAFALFAYLFAIQAGSQVLLRRRSWWWPSALAVAGGFVWAAIWLGAMPRDWSDDVWLAVFLMATSAAAAWTQRTLTMPERLELWTPVHWQGPATHAVALLAMGGLTVAAGYDFYGWLFFGLLAAGQMVLARFCVELEPLAALAAGLAALLLASAPISQDALTAETIRFIGAALVLGGLFAVGGFGALLGARHPMRWALLSTLSASAFFLIAYGRLRGLDQLPPWGLVSLALAALAVGAAEIMTRYRTLGRGYEEALGVYALAASGFIAFAIPVELEHAWIAVAWALLLPAIAWIESRLHIARFRYAAWIAAGLALARLLPGPWVVEVPIGTTPIVNWLLYGYGVPLLAFGGAAWMFRRERDDALVTVLEAGAVAIGFLLVTLELHHAFQDGLFYRFDLGLDELSCLIIAWLLIALGLFRLPARIRPVHTAAMAHAVAGLAAVTVVLGPLLFANPLLTAEEVGSWPLVNWLIPAYAISALLLAALARDLRGPRRQWTGLSASVLALLLGFAFVTLELRQWFHGGRLDLGAGGDAENYAYSVGWILYGAALLVAGIVRGGAALRWASLAVVVLAMGKVFLFDARELTGLFRVASFLGLGISLLAIGYVYQRVVFRRPPQPMLAVTPPPTRS